MNGANFHYINLFYATRYPNRNITFINCGISGNTTDNILKRFETDILIFKPTIAVLMIEENDLQPSLYLEARKNEPGIEERKEKRIENWCRNADSLVSLLLKANIKVILEAPTIYDQTGQLPSENAYGVNDALGKCVEYQRYMSKKYSVPLVDCWSVMNEDNKIIQSKDPTKSIIGYDRVHVSPLGYFVIANTFLNDQNLEKKVSAVNIDVRKNKILNAENCTISNLHTNNTGATFEYLSQSLPFPTPDGLNPDTLHPFTKDLNSEILQIGSLKGGQYNLFVDSSLIGAYSAKDFEKGINLSQNPATPQFKQSQKILNLFYEYWKNERQLRVLKYVELSFINGKIKDAYDMDTIKMKLDAILDRSKTSPNYDYFKNIFGIYLSAKPNEKEIEQKNITLYKSIFAINKPEKHVIKIVKAM